MSAANSFLGLPSELADGNPARIVIFGVAHGSAYPDQDSGGHETAADQIRSQARKMLRRSSIGISISVAHSSTAVR